MSKKQNTVDDKDQPVQDDANIVDDKDQNVKEKKSKKKSKKSSAAQEEIEELNIQVGELKDKYLRLFAEFDNYKKRTSKERIELMKTAAQETVVALLPVLDDFDRAKKNAEDDNSTEPFSEGVMLVYNKLNSILSQRGLEAMESTNETFDPELHSAITEIPAPTEEMKGKIIDTVERGYLLKDKIIRHAKVVVGK
ncbi:MAG: nucleotide exchange factor GrpE [Saprospiraceae bacterium]